jgi:hypothetical protein
LKVELLGTETYGVALKFSCFRNFNLGTTPKRTRAVLELAKKKAAFRRLLEK